MGGTMRTRDSPTRSMHRHCLQLQANRSCRSNHSPTPLAGATLHSQTVDTALHATAITHAHALSIMQILIEYHNGEKRDPLEIDLSESVEFLRFQLYSLTGVPPAEQTITGITMPTGNAELKDHMQLRALGLSAGQRLIVTRKLTDTAASAPAAAPIPAARPAAPATAAVAAPTPAAPVAAAAAAASPARAAAPPVSSSAVSAVSMAATAQQAFTCCSRSFFGTEAIVQPSATAHGSIAVCYACAQTCHLPTDIKPRPTTAPMVCACANENEAGRECIFAVRSKSAADQLHGQVKAQTQAALAHAAVQMNESMLAQGKAQMQARIGAHIRAVLEYENPEWQAQARALIPLEKLQTAAAKAIAEGSALDPRDQLMEQLLHWFKHEFFSWVNAPSCDTCGAGTENIGAARPNAAEAPFRPGVVEIYKCGQGHLSRFPRYNHASKLLETRRGRCGEWAQAFTLCCRAIGFEARSANDWTDHV